MVSGFGAEYDKIVDRWETITHCTGIDNFRVIGETSFAPLKKVLGRLAGSASRADLLVMLSKRAVEAGELRFDSHVVEVEEFSNDKSGGGVRLTLKDGSVEEFDLVIGCDGKNSKICRHINPSRKTDHHFANLCSFYGTIRDDALNFKHPILKPHGMVSIMCGRLVFHTYMGGDHVRYWHAERPVAEDESRQVRPHSWISDATTASPKAEVEALISNLPQDHPARELVERTPEDTIVYFGLHAEPSRPAEQWHAGRIAVMGDALHPTLPYTGQGANMSIEDGFVMANCLVNADFEPQTAFLNFRQQRSGKIESTIKKSLAIGDNFFKAPLWLRELKFKLLHWSKQIPNWQLKNLMGNACVDVPVDKEYLTQMKKQEREKKFKLGSALAIAGGFALAALFNSKRRTVSGS